MQSRKVILAAAAAVAIAAGSFFYWLRVSDAGVSIQQVRVGALLPLNPDLMAVATRMQNGMNLARDDLMARYGNRLDLTINYQNGCYEDEAAKAVQMFVHEGVSIISGSFCLFGHIPILPLVEAHRIVTFNTATNPDIVLNRRFAFSTNVEVRNQAADMADFAFDYLRRRKAVTMHLDTPFGHDYNKYFKRRFEERGGEVLFNVPNAPDGKDFSTVIPRIKSAQPDTVVTAHFGVPLGLFFKELRGAGIDCPILGNYETEDPDVLLAAGDAAEGVFVATTEAQIKSAVMKQFEARYVRQFGVMPDSIVTNSYDALILSVESALSCDGDRECMRKELHKVRDYKGVSGLITIAPTGATDKPSSFKTIRSQTFIGVDYAAKNRKVTH